MRNSDDGLQLFPLNKIDVSCVKKMEQLTTSLQVNDGLECLRTTGLLDALAILSAVCLAFGRLR
jgi:hypothetical protein